LTDPLFIFDLDNTLYPPEVTLWKTVDERIELYVRRTLGVDPEAARRIRTGFLREFGTTLRGLMHHHGVAPAEYLAFVHDVAVSEIVRPRPALGTMLSDLPGRRIVFTNGSESYARRVLEALGVAHLMDGVYGIEFMDYIAKPMPYAYEKLLRTTGAGAGMCLFCEDIRENLLPARALGMFTVWVGGREEDPGAHAVIADVCDLPRILSRFLTRADGRGRTGGVPEGRGARHQEEDR
jgi:putative hydrolase of the HAD superfamily